MSKPTILVICTGNSCRSQMAEGYLRKFGGDDFEVHSAGLEAHGLNPRAIQVMEEDGVDISGHESELLESYLRTEPAYIITVCDHAAEHCPFFPGEGKRIHRSFKDPAKATGSEKKIMDQFRAVRDEIREFAANFIEELRA